MNGHDDDGALILDVHREWLVAVIERRLDDASRIGAEFVERWPVLSVPVFTGVMIATARTTGGLLAEILGATPGSAAYACTVHGEHPSGARGVPSCVTAEVRLATELVLALARPGLDDQVVANAGLNVLAPVLGDHQLLSAVCAELRSQLHETARLAARHRQAVLN